MAGFAVSTAAHEFKRAFFEAARDLWATDHPEFLVSWGEVTGTVPDEYFLVMGTDSEQAAATMGTNRSRDEVLRPEVQLFVFRWGEVDAAKEADDYLYARLGEIERHVRMVDTTLGGVVRECALLNHATDTASTERDSTQGHLAAAIAIFEAKVRVTG